MPECLHPIDADLQVPDCRKFKAHTGREPQILFEQTMHDLLLIVILLAVIKDGA